VADAARQRMCWTGESIHQHVGFEVTDAHRRAIEAYFAERPKERPGRHTYGLEECGLDEQSVRDALVK